MHLQFFLSNIPGELRVTSLRRRKKSYKQEVKRTIPNPHQYVTKGGSRTNPKTPLKLKKSKPAKTQPNSALHERRRG